MFPLWIIASDSSLGRIDKASLSDQTLMELVVDGLKGYKRILQDEHGIYLDVWEWPDIECNPENQVTKISYYDLTGGELALDFLPPLIKQFQVVCFSEDESSKVHGTLNTSKLPSNLESLILSNNKFYGTVDMTTLPANLTSLGLIRNEFTGSCDFTALPAGLLIIDIRTNKFSGSLRIDALPPNMEGFLVGTNEFSGSLGFEKLPKAPFLEIDISAAKFSGEFRFLQFPPKFIGISAKNNQFSATAVVSSALQDEVSLGGKRSTVTAVVDESGKRHSMEAIMLEA